MLACSLEVRSQYYLDLSEGELVKALLKEKVKDIFRSENDEGVFISWTDSTVEWRGTAFFLKDAVVRTVITPFDESSKNDFVRYLNNSSGAIKLTNTDWKLPYMNKFAIIELRKVGTDYSFTIYRL